MSIEPNRDLSHRSKKRKQTDKSLEAERIKADSVLLRGKAKVEHRADDAVAEKRAKIDETKSKIRKEIDLNVKESIQSNKKSLANACLQEERHAVDEAIFSERRHIDSILDSERKQNLTREFDHFHSERVETDKNLNKERQENDADIRHVAQVLSEEKEAHIATQTALTTRDEFLAIVSHDLRNPLGTISMVVSLLTRGKGLDSVDAQTRKYIEMIGRNADNALRLIEDLLDVERVASGKLCLETHRHNLGTLIQEQRDNFKLQASKKDISLKTLGPIEELWVHCDRNRTHQILANLLCNALKFTPSGGAVTISAHLVKDGNEVEVSVIDNGPGLPQSMCEKVFERFWQIGKLDRNGLGLGLYISRMLTEAQGGRIGVDSHVGQGSRFYFTLPA